MLLAGFIMAGWAIVVFWALFIEIQDRAHQDRQDILFKWLAVLMYMGFGAIFIVADSPLASTEHRPHVVITFAGVAIFSAAYSLRVLAARYPSMNGKLSQCLSIFFVAMIAFGAQAGLLRGYVNNRMEQLDFIRTELMAEDPAHYQNVIVVLPEWSGCVTEPCGRWAGHVTQAEWHMTREEGYRYALATIGISPESKSITFMREKPKEIPPGSIIIDWAKYVSVRHPHTNSLRSNASF